MPSGEIPGLGGRALRSGRWGGGVLDVPRSGVAIRAVEWRASVEVEDLFEADEGLVRGAAGG